MLQLIKTALGTGNGSLSFDKWQQIIKIVMSEDSTFEVMTNAILAISRMLQTDPLLLFPSKYWDKEGNLKKTESTAA